MSYNKNLLNSAQADHLQVLGDEVNDQIERFAEKNATGSSLLPVALYAKIYTPDDCQHAIRLARKDNPYHLKVMEHKDFLVSKHCEVLLFPKL